MIVIGDGEERKKLEKLADNNKNIIFTGRISNEEVIKILENSKLNKDIIFTVYVDNKKLIAEAKILIQPSLYEGFGIPSLEALTLGTDVILSDIEVFKEIYSDLPVSFFEANNSEKLKEIILEKDIWNKSNLINMINLKNIGLKILKELENEG